MRMTVERAEAICVEHNFELSNGVYFKKDERCGCGIGLMAVDKCGGITDAAQHIGDLAIDLDYPSVAKELGEPLEYVVGLETGFEGRDRASIGLFPWAFERNEAFWQGIVDGAEIFYARQRGQLPGKIKWGRQPEQRAALVQEAEAALKTKDGERVSAYVGATNSSA